MINETQKLINERFNELPEIVRESISNSSWRDSIRDIVAKNKLLIDQGLAIEKETFLMMLGVENPKNYTRHIKKQANLTKEQAISIAFDVEEKILDEIKRKIIEKTEEDLDMSNNPLKDILGPKKIVDDAIPSIDTNLDNDEVSDRKDLINELGDDIEIEQEETEDELTEKAQFEKLSQTQKEKELSTTTPNNLPIVDLPEKTSNSNKIPVIVDTNPNPRFIETNFSKTPDNLPSLEPVRTLETDSENRDDIVTSKLAGTEIKKTEIKPETPAEIPQKPKGPDPYRESF